MTEFEKRVYGIIKKISRGEVLTYKQVAVKLGNAGLARAVGNALNKNRDKKVPCHRVIGSNGHLTGFAHGLKKKSEFLRKEGIIVRDFKIVDFDRVLFKF